MSDFEDASRGLIEPFPAKIYENNKIVWDLDQFNFLNTIVANHHINHKLLRHAKLLYKNGLFKINESIYQIRSGDACNMTIIEGASGLIIVDPLSSISTAKAALHLYYKHKPRTPTTKVANIIVTHSHADHYGGIKGVAELDSKIWVPKGYEHATMTENVLLGNIMARRTMFQFGNLLQPGPTGQVSSGLSLALSSGTESFLTPTNYIDHDCALTIDGVDLEFVYFANIEAPVEIAFFLPQYSILCAAEVVTRTMHNMCTLRGAKTRDALAWVKAINKLINKWTPLIIIGSHGWPVWKNCDQYLTNQRDMYKFMHDQTLRLANKGYNMDEIAAELVLPQSLALPWENVGYYGNLEHNCKSIYNFYLGFFDGNPLNLFSLSPEDQSATYVSFFPPLHLLKTRVDNLIVAQKYKQAVLILKHVIKVYPCDKEFSALLATCLTQLGYATENAVHRNFALSGAEELTSGINTINVNTANSDMIDNMSFEMLLDYLAIRLNEKALCYKIFVHFLVNIGDTQQPQTISVLINNSVLNYTIGKALNKLNADYILIEMYKQDFVNFVMGDKTLHELEQNLIHIDGNKVLIEPLSCMFDKFTKEFKLVK